MATTIQPVDPGQEALAQTQASVLNAITTAPVSTPAPLTDTAAKIGIFSNPTYSIAPEVPPTGLRATQEQLDTFGPQVQKTAETSSYYQNPPAVNDNEVSGKSLPDDSPYSFAGMNRESTGLKATQEQLDNFGPQYNDSNYDYSPPIIPANDVTFKAAKDWRVRLSLAPGAKYLYNGSNPGILAPLKSTDGVIFPYTPTIAISYSASYDPTEITHTNYKIQQYRNSSVGDLTITAEFTAQDTNEANYLLATIHFFKSVTKMFYGQDKNPPNGVPPPLCYLTGYGAYQFDNHPLVVTNFSFTLPNDVDYIRAGDPNSLGGQNLQNFTGVKQPSTDRSSSIAGFILSKVLRLKSSGAPPGAQPEQPNWTVKEASEATYVPTKMTITLTCAPMVTRKDVSNKFSLDKYGSGELLRGSKNNSGGFW